MLRNDVAILCERSGLSKTTIYRRAEKAGIDLTPQSGRCDKTIDAFSGETLSDEHEKWLNHALTKILQVPDKREKSKPEVA